MSATIGTFLAFIALLIAWNRLKKLARAIVRDRIFDLRDTLRRHYVENNLEMTDGAYERLRDFLNNLLRNMKDMRMMEYLYFASHLNRSDVEAATAEFDESLKKCNPETAELIRHLRRKACEETIKYMAETSLGFISITLVVLMFVLPNKLLSGLKRCMNNLVTFKPATLEYAVTP